MRLPLPALFLIAATAAFAANTQISTDKPILNFRLPTFTPDGHRSWLVRGSEARYFNPNRIDITELTLSVYSGQADEKIETILLSPEASVQPADAVVTGPGSIRVIDDEFEAVGAVWRYEHKAKKVSIAQNVKVTFHTELKDFLK